MFTCQTASAGEGTGVVVGVLVVVGGGRVVVLALVVVTVGAVVVPAVVVVVARVVDAGDDSAPTQPVMTRRGIPIHRPACPVGWAPRDQEEQTPRAAKG